MPEAYPLCWPDGRRRTPAYLRRFGAFKDHSRDKAIRELNLELRRLGAKNIVISSNLKLRLDGLPLAKQPKFEDPGVAVYFEKKGKQFCFACDSYQKDATNIWAIYLTIEAIRGIERWGSSDMMEAAFTGFAALPGATAAPARHWSEVLGVSVDCAPEELIRAYRMAAKSAHPDSGGTNEAFNEVTTAFFEAKKYKGLVY